MLISSVGILPYSVGYLIKFFNLTSAAWVSVMLSALGWWMMLTGQSFVLYSRLRIVYQNLWVLRLIKAMININIFILRVSTTVLAYVANFFTSLQAPSKDTMSWRSCNWPNSASKNS